MVCCYRQLFEFTKTSQDYKNNGGISIGCPYIQYWYDRYIEKCHKAECAAKCVQAVLFFDTRNKTRERTKPLIGAASLHKNWTGADFQPGQFSKQGSCHTGAVVLVPIILG